MFGARLRVEAVPFQQVARASRLTLLVSDAAVVERDICHATIRALLQRTYVCANNCLIGLDSAIKVLKIV